MRFALPLALATVALAASTANAATITYTGTNGASATANFSFAGSTLTVLLTNTSTSPFNGGGAAAILSSLNFDLPDGVTILGGSVALGPGSSVVTQYNNKGDKSWVDTTSPNLNSEFAFSNNGVGNTGTGVVVGALNAVTSHNNGSANLTRFDGVPGAGATGGLDPGILAFGTPVFGNNSKHVMNSLLFTLNLSGPLANLDFLANGSYVEFGSDAQFITGFCSPTDCPPPCTANCPGDTVPEPTSLALVGLGLLGAATVTRRRK